MFSLLGHAAKLVGDSCLGLCFPSVSDCARWEILPFREKSFDLGDFLVKLFEENGMPLEGYFLCVQD